MALHIIHGGPTRKGPWAPIYIGPSGSESQAAITASSAAFHLIQHNPPTWVKSNPNFVAPVMVPVPDVIEEAAPVIEPPSSHRRKK